MQIWETVAKLRMILYRHSDGMHPLNPILFLFGVNHENQKNY